MDGTRHCYSKAASSTETQFGTLLPLLLQPAQKLSRLFHQNYLKTEFRSNLMPSNRCSISCFSPLKASLHPSTATSTRQTGMETKHWEQSQPWNPDIHHQISHTLTKLLFHCRRTSEAGYLQEGAKAISVALPSERSGLCSVAAAGGGCWEQRKGPA